MPNAPPCYNVFLYNIIHFLCVCESVKGYRWNASVNSRFKVGGEKMKEVIMTYIINACFDALGIIAPDNLKIFFVVNVVSFQ